MNIIKYNENITNAIKSVYRILIILHAISIFFI